MTERTVTLPLTQIIQVYPGFWFCRLCTQAGRPGLGRHWSETAQADAEALSVKHLREHHGLTEVGHLTEHGEIAYLNQTDIARRLNVGLSTVNGWLARYQNTEHSFPASCELPGERRRWRADQWPVIEKWLDDLRKRSAGTVGATSGAFPPPGFVTYAGVGVWISHPGTWVKAALAGEITLHAPFPKPDLNLKRRTTTAPLWSVERRPEVEEWYAEQKKVNAQRELQRKRKGVDHA